MAKDFDIKIEGLRELRRDLREMDRETLKAVQGALKDASELAAVRARSLAPRRSGALAESYRPFTRGNVAGVRSRLPYAGVIEFGGTIRPRGTAITIRPFRPLTRAVEEQRDRMAERVGDELEAVARRTGWK